MKAKISTVKLLAFFLSTMLCVGFASCKDDDDNDETDNLENEIIGNWQFDDLEGGGYVHELYCFYPDGTYELEGQEGSYSSGTLSSWEESGTYTLSGKNLTLVCTNSSDSYEVGYSSSYTVSITGEKMTWMDSDGETMELYKKSYHHLPGDY